MRSDRAIFLKIRGTNSKGWLWLKFCNGGGVRVLFVLFRDSSYVSGAVVNLLLYSFI